MEISTQIPAIISAVIFLVVAFFQILLSLGLPLGEFSWGGSYNGVLPQRLRIASVIAASILLCMAFIVLIHTKVLSMDLNFIPTNILVWIITIFMGLNTMGNFASKSKNEKIFMTPLTSIAFLSCLIVSVFS